VYGINKVMDLPWIQAIGAAVIISLISLIGIFVFSRNQKTLRRRVSFVIALAVGALLANAFLDLIPEALEGNLSEQNVSLFVIGGIFIFFIIDKYLHWHCHDGGCKIEPLGHKAIIADGVHNLVDGIVIGSAFLTSTDLGIAITIAVALHEIPQEIVDFGILLHAGYTRARAILLNFASALVAVVGVIIALLIGNSADNFTPAMLAIAAGMFIYLAGSDLIPELHKEPKLSKSVWQLFAVALGVLIIFLV
jgi:zinc and cadmium transporter